MMMLSLLRIDCVDSAAGPHLRANTVCSNQQVVVTLLWAAAASVPVLGLQRDAPGLQVEGLHSRRPGLNTLFCMHMQARRQDDDAQAVHWQYT
jgi:hypothetical protein